MSRYLSIINYRTLVCVLLSALIPYVAYRFKVIYNIDLTLMSIAIIFPLVFTIRGAFRRREKALEHLSRFHASLRTFENILISTKSLKEEDLKTGVEKINHANSAVMNFLKSADENTQKVDDSMKDIVDFVMANSEAISGGTRQRLFRFLKDSIESSNNLIGIHTHRTPISLKAYCLIFIYIFPVVYTPTIINKIGLDNPAWLTYFVVILSEFILISLYNIQDHIEYPFDDNGLDDIKLSKFEMSRK